MHSYAYGNQIPTRWGIDPRWHTVACKRYPVRKLLGYDSEGRIDRNHPRNILPFKYVESLEQNQQIASCCRHPENHDIEAWFSSPDDARKGIPDIYKLYCTCGRVHVRFCVGGGDRRPTWDVR